MARSASIAASLFGLFGALTAPPGALADEQHSDPAPRAVGLRSEPRSHRGPATSATAWVVTPAGTARRANVFFHGWSLCAEAMMASAPVRCAVGERPIDGWLLDASHRASGSNAWLVVPQLAWKARDSDPGRFRGRGFFARYAEGVEVAARATLGRDDGEAPLSSGRLVLYAHSGGFATLLAVLRDPAVRARVDAVVMLDALYAGAGELAEWLAESERRRLVVLHTSQERTSAEAARLVSALRARGIELGERDSASLEERVRARRVLIERTNIAHGRLPQETYRDIEAGLTAALAE